MTREQVPDELDFASVDVSFISLYHIFPTLRTLLKEGGRAVCLIKPQFEAGRENVGKKGVVRDAKVHEEVIFRIVSLVRQLELVPKALTFSPVKGPEGNIEYLIWLSKDAAAVDGVTDELVFSTVQAAHGALDK